jgi:hypothetical protein
LTPSQRSVSGTIPDILHDSFNEILQAWTNVKTGDYFTTNTGLIRTVSKRADGSVSAGVEILDNDGATATASNYSPYPEDDIQNIFD